MEIWRQTKQNPHYEVSTYGRVRSNKGPYSTLLRPGKAVGGKYLTVVLHPLGTYSVHSLVLTAFVGSRPSGHEAAHIDGNGHNNRLENLMWATPKVNAAQRVGHGTQHRGEKTPNARLTEADVRAIRKRWDDGESRTMIAESFPSLSVGTIEKAVSNKTWRHLPHAVRTRATTIPHRRGGKKSDERRRDW